MQTDTAHVKPAIDKVTSELVELRALKESQSQLEGIVSKYDSQILKVSESCNQLAEAQGKLSADVRDL